MSNSQSYYTDIDPSEYYDLSATPIATKTFTISDRTLSDSARYSSDSRRNIRVKLPNEIGNKMLAQYKANPEYFANGKVFNEHVNPGYYVKFEKGDGVMMDIYVGQLNIRFKYFAKSSTGRLDSLATGTTTFAATEEVIQATSIKKYNLEKLLNDKDATYLKTPSSLFTEVALPISEISINDTINSAKLIFDKYSAENTGADYNLPAPSYLLMVPKDRMYSFFENNEVPDDQTTYMSTFSTSNNNYSFDNIAHLISNMRKAHQDGIAHNPNWEIENPNWNKVVLIPVAPVYSTGSSNTSSYYYSYYYYGSSSSSSSNTVVGVNHDLSLTSARLKKNGVNKIYFHEVDMNREKAMIDYLDIENIYKYPMFDYSDFDKYAKLQYKFIIFNVNRYEIYSYLDKTKLDNTIKHIESTKEYFNNCLENSLSYFFIRSLNCCLSIS